MHGYKIFNSDWTCRGKQYSCPGEFTQEGELKLCENGIHFCRKLIDCFYYYVFSPQLKMAEVEATGKVVWSTDKRKFCTDHIKIKREILWDEVADVINMGEKNIGCKNTGSYNIGVGNSNNRNVGSYNAGNCNTGIYNVGDGNRGSFNCGSYNIGDNNVGFYNIGCCNSGMNNTGCNNTGCFNIGDNNTGDYNVTSFSTGCFNTKETTIMMFNKDSGMTYDDWVNSEAYDIMDNMPNPVKIVPYEKLTDVEKEMNPAVKTTGIYIKKRNIQEVQDWWNDLRDFEKKIILELPNFDRDVFKECTGIDVGEEPYGKKCFTCSM